MHSAVLWSVTKEKIAAEKVETAADYSIWNKPKGMGWARALQFLKHWEDVLRTGGWCRASHLHTKWFKIIHWISENGKKMASRLGKVVYGMLVPRCFRDGLWREVTAANISLWLCPWKSSHTEEHEGAAEKSCYRLTTSIISIPLPHWGRRQRCKEQRSEAELEGRQGKGKVLFFSVLCFLLTKSSLFIHDCNLKVIHLYLDPFSLCPVEEKEWAAGLEFDPWPRLTIIAILFK